MQREKWVKNLRQVQFVCTSTDGEKSDKKEKESKDGADLSIMTKHSKSMNGYKKRKSPVASYYCYCS